MPIYEYRCTKCEQVTEALQKVSDPPLRRCPSCGAKLEKLISRTSFQLKGGGWYAEGYGGAGAKPEAADGKKGDAAPSGESKGEATKEKKKGSGEPGPKAATG